MDRWVRFQRQAQQDLKLWGFSLALLTAFRVLFIIIFHERMQAGSTWYNVLLTLANGLRYDLVVASAVVLPAFLLSALCAWRDCARAAERVRRWLAVAFVCGSLILCAASVPFFAEFNEQFNTSIFNIYYDDTLALLSTMLFAYKVPLYLLAVVLLAVPLVRFCRRGLLPWGRFDGWLARRQRLPWQRAVAVVLLLVLFTGGLRGSWGPEPLRRRNSAEQSMRWACTITTQRGTDPK